MQVSARVESALSNLSKFTSVVDGTAKGSSVNGSNDSAGVLSSLSEIELLIVSISFSFELAGDFERLRSLIVVHGISNNFIDLDKIRSNENEYCQEIILLASHAISELRDKQKVSSLMSQLKTTKPTFYKKYQPILKGFQCYLAELSATASETMSKNCKHVA